MTITRKTITHSASHLFDAWWVRHQGAALACTHETLAVMGGPEIETLRGQGSGEQQ